MQRCWANIGAAIFVSLVIRIPAVAQDEDYSIRVRADQVLVPVTVERKDGRIQPCFLNPAGMRETEVRDCGVLLGLGAKDFRVFEDGVAQKIQSAVFLPSPDAEMRDAGGYHHEHSASPRGKWIFPVTQTIPLVEHLPFYQIAYARPPSEEGSCHKVRVTVDRRDARVFARGEYCNVENATVDRLTGTEFGRQLEQLAIADKKSAIPMFTQINYFLAGAQKYRVDVSVEFPWNLIKRYWKTTGDFDTKIGILGIAYSSNVAKARFSDDASVKTFSPSGTSNNPDPSEVDPRLFIPTGYEVQIELDPGQYTLKIVLSDASKFGRVEIPLQLETHHPSELSVSSLALCKSFLPTSVTRESTAVNLAPQYVPLVSKDTQFTPAGNTHFKRGEPLIAYFEVYEPLLAANSKTKVQVRLKITNQQTGEVKTDTGYRPADSWVEPGSSTIHIAENIARDQLPSGSYRLEVQASDSTGRSTTWRGAAFTVE